MGPCSGHLSSKQTFRNKAERFKICHNCYHHEQQQQTCKNFDIIYYCVPEESEARLDKKLHNIGFFHPQKEQLEEELGQKFCTIFFRRWRFPNEKRAIIVREREIF